MVVDLSHRTATDGCVVRRLPCECRDGCTGMGCTATSALVTPARNAAMSNLPLKEGFVCCLFVAHTAQ